MARHKKVYRDEEYELDLKRDKIRNAVRWSFIVLVSISIMVGGIYQHNNILCGSAVVFLGIICLGYAAFEYITDEFGWKTLTIYDSPELRHSKHLFSDSVKKEQDEILFLRLFAVIGFSILGVVLLVVGLLRLFSII